MTTFANKALNFFQRYRMETAIFAMALGIKMAFYLIFGMQNGGDTVVYVQFAKIFAGLLPFSDAPDYLGYFYLYWGYPAFTSPIFRFTQNLELYYSIVIVSQIVISSFSVVCLYKTLCILTRNSKILSAVTCFLYTSNFQIINWDRYVLTDSFNLSLMMILFYMAILILGHIRNETRHNALLVGFLLLSTYFLFCRPTNGVFVIIVSLFLVFSKKNTWITTRQKAIGIGLFLSISAIIFFSITTDGKQNFLVMLYNWHSTGHVINARPYYDAIRHDWAFFPSWLNQTLFILKVIVKRFVLLWAITVQNFSLNHTIYNYIILFPLWVCSLLSTLYIVFRRHIGQKEYLMLALIFSYNLFFSVTWLDYDFRLRLAILPYLYMISATGIYYIKQEYLDSPSK